MSAKRKGQSTELTPYSMIECPQMDWQDFLDLKLGRSSRFMLSTLLPVLLSQTKKVYQEKGRCLC